jgi:hypothetical protein
MVQGINIEGSRNTTNHLSQSQQYYYAMPGLLKGKSYSRGEMQKRERIYRK